jgi:hypothetical protein
MALRRRLSAGLLFSVCSGSVSLRLTEVTLPCTGGIATESATGYAPTGYSSLKKGLSD